ncbi:hypothetical protein AKJ38_02805 [candidate division MSBL1 archaeon SCGC-AAA259I14]|uniref:Uncharacterized protein n=3 Tax=candidate division MSBL1 TaxID=215777 RepID=A0A133URE0_9EURY|nr:hypothetical protein AKJ66_03700 [candidate division MSBL1 archaeon SCGC-AAA259E22]KXA95190.1 hypothetical protein AKJ36_01320 [candidate division MSBL1 archaeon SCGC-AAA259I07]KXA96697.1 hypothetical protein AKJ38_02805 [candidate division MSBL1 archaeon SCGC-AAA259I14]
MIFLKLVDKIKPWVVFGLVLFLFSFLLMTFLFPESAHLFFRMLTKTWQGRILGILLLAYVAISIGLIFFRYLRK